MIFGKAWKPRLIYLINTKLFFMFIQHSSIDSFKKSCRSPNGIAQAAILIERLELAYRKFDQIRLLLKYMVSWTGRKILRQKLIGFREHFMFKKQVKRAFRKETCLAHSLYSNVGVGVSQDRCREDIIYTKVSLRLHIMC